MEMYVLHLEGLLVLKQHIEASVGKRVSWVLIASMLSSTMETRRGGWFRSENMHSPDAVTSTLKRGGQNAISPL